MYGEDGRYGNSGLGSYRRHSYLSEAGCVQPLRRRVRESWRAQLQYRLDQGPGSYLYGFGEPVPSLYHAGVYGEDGRYGDPGLGSHRRHSYLPEAGRVQPLRRRVRKSWRTQIQRLVDHGSESHLYSCGKPVQTLYYAGVYGKDGKPDDCCLRPLMERLCEDKGAYRSGIRN